MGRPFRIERSAALRASPEAVFAVISDLGRWEAWSPYAAMDPATVSTLSGDPASVGGSYEWKGPKMGAGRMEITSISPGERVVMKLEFFAPMKATNEATFSVAPTPSGGTTVTWAMTGERPWAMVVLAMLLRLDRMVEGQFDQGLARLRTLCDGG